MNVAHPNYGQNYQLTRAALRLGTFTASELEDLTSAPKNTIYSFVSKLRQVGDNILTDEELQSLRGRPQKRYSLTDAGTKYLAELSFELASRFGKEGEAAQVRGVAEAMEGILLPSDFYEEDQELVVQVEVPGLSADDVDVRIEDNDLVVSGERPGFFRRHGAVAYIAERQHGPFLRTFPLPGAVKATITNVEVKNGVLEVTLEKNTHAQAAAISTSEDASNTRTRSAASGVVGHYNETAEH
jgi:HSP20 family molecular chaperone IbpA